MTEAQIKGWCPGAHRPMMSGDGLVVRVRPRFAEISHTQALGLCDLAEHFGPGTIDLTNRANLQLRGVAPEDHTAVLEGLHRLDVLDADPESEARRNVLPSPFWRPGDDTEAFTRGLYDSLDQMPPMPAKVGFAVDTGDARVLADGSADFRLERGLAGFVLRADGAALGRPVEPDSFAEALLELVRWFADRVTPTKRRMRAVLGVHELPSDWQVAEPAAIAPPPQPGRTSHGVLLGAAFGQIRAHHLRRALETSGARALRITPWRMILLLGVGHSDAPGFVTSADHPLMAADACAGAPLCPQASVETRDLATALALKTKDSVHVSGCAKSCARRSAAAWTLVGRDGRFDLVKDGHPWDAPCRTGLSPAQILALVG